MVGWTRFAEDAPELATIGERLLHKTGLCLLGTLRKDGWPRISPCEVYIVDGELMLGMMWRSKKALDLIRDSRVVVHSATCDRNGHDGDFKLYGRTVDVSDPAARAHYADAVEAEINWRPKDPYHLFAVDAHSASYINYAEDDRRAMRWDRERGFEHIRHPDD
jgi:hypothetical protein